MNTEKDYYSSIHKLGRWSTLTAVFLMLLVPILTMVIYKVRLNWALTLSAMMQMAIVFIPTQLTEVLSYAPIIGAGGTYLAFVTGNVSNMKLPAAASCHKMANVEPSSDEGEVISVLAIGTSAIVTAALLFIAMLASAPLANVLQQPALQAGFNNIMPVLMGAMFAPYLKNHAKLVVLPLVIATLFGALLPSAKYSGNQGLILLGTMVVSVLFVILMNRKKQNT